MRKTMTIRGFILILTLVLAVFLTLHLLMRGDLSRKAQQEELDKATLAAVRRWAKTYKGGQKPEDLPALFNGWADRNERTQR